MKKTVIAPGFGSIDSDEIDEPQVSLAVATHHGDHKKVEINGLVYPEGDIETQVRENLGLIEKVVDDLDGSMDDITKLRWHVDEDEHSEDIRTRIHEARADFFEHPNYPASCLLVTPTIPVEGAALEVEARATIPENGWEVETITGEE